MAQTWPFALKFQSQAWAKSSSSRTGGAGLTGVQQIVRTDAGFWTAQATLAFSSTGRRRGEPLSLAYRALYAALDGMAGEVDVPCVTPWRPYDINGRMHNANAAAGFTENMGLFDHSGFGQAEVATVWVDSAAALRATRLVLRHDGEGLRPGHFFGIGPRLYLVARAWALSSAGVGGEMDYGAQDMFFGGEQIFFGTEGEKQAVEFWPPLREAVAADVPLILGRPVCRMRLASDDTGVFEHTPGGVVAPSLEFVESV
jgi:hypothetical protein